MKCAIMLLVVLLICGCVSDVVGEPEFICPVCGAEAQLHSVGDEENREFHFHCAVCFIRSGNYESFTEAIKVWKVKGD